MWEKTSVRTCFSLLLNLERLLLLLLCFLKVQRKNNVKKENRAATLRLYWRMDHARKSVCRSNLTRSKQYSEIELHNLCGHKRSQLFIVVSISTLCVFAFRWGGSAESLARFDDKCRVKLESPFFLFSLCRLPTEMEAEGGRAEHYFPLNWTRWIFVYTSITWFHYYHISPTKGSFFRWRRRQLSDVDVDYAAPSIKEEKKLFQGLFVSLPPFDGCHAWILPSSAWIIDNLATPQHVIISNGHIKAFQMILPLFVVFNSFASLIHCVSSRSLYLPTPPYTNVITCTLSSDWYINSLLFFCHSKTISRKSFYW